MGQSLEGRLKRRPYGLIFLEWVGAMRVIEAIVRDIGEFSRRLLPEHALRGYQLETARAILSLIAGKRGGKAVAVFSRQSGKDEMLAQTLAFLLFTRQQRGGRMVVVLPSHQQASISMNRLVNRLENIALLQGRFRAAGREVQLGNASVRFMSGAASAQVRGDTADLLLVRTRRKILPLRFGMRVSTRWARASIRPLCLWVRRGLRERC
ncbi:hypothetical protein [Candidatus Chlorohelix sp.]|uniref:hypothetical protein n=1 Tax=Candidatus Chlorohelix sp. TaxID=3139201 RepID=UPI003050CB19